MSKLKFLACSFIAIIFHISCSVQEIESPESKLVEKTFYATTDQDTKTSIDGSSVTWNIGDELCVMDRYTSSCARIYGLSSDKKKGIFSATVTEGEQVYAFYPYSSSVNFSRSVINATIPSEQSGVFSDLGYSVAKSNSGSFCFQNATSIFRFSVDRTRYPDVAYVKIESIDGKNLVGDICITYEPDMYVERGISGSRSLVVSLTDQDDQYASIIPGNYPNGFKFTLMDSSRKAVKYVTFEKGVLALSGRLFEFSELTDHLDAKTICSEKFSRCSSVGGKDDDFTSFGSLITSPDSYTDLSGWKLDNCYECHQCILIGSEDAVGYAVTPALGITSGSATVVLYAAGFGLDYNYLSNVSVVGNGGISTTQCTFIPGEFNEVRIQLTDADKNTKLKFSATDKSSRYYIDDFEVKDGSYDFTYLNISSDYQDLLLEADFDECLIPLRTNANDISVAYKSPSYALYDHVNRNVSFTAPENTSLEALSWKLLVGSSSAGTEYYLSINQKPATKIALSEHSLSFSKEGSSEDVEILTYNFEEEGLVITAEPDTTSDVLSAVVDGNTLKVTTFNNTGKKPLDAKVVVTAVGKIAGRPALERTRRDTLNVHQEVPAYIDADPTELSFGFAGESKSVAYEVHNFGSGVNCTATLDASLTGFTASVDALNNKVTVTAPENTSVESLSGKLTITATDTQSNESSVEVSITQGGAPKVEFVETFIPEFAAEGGNTQFNVRTYNMDSATLEVSATPADVFSCKSVAANRYEVTAASNDTGVQRTGTLTVKATSGDIVRTATMSLSQSGLMEKSISFSTSSVTAYYDGTGLVLPTLNYLEGRPVTYSISENVFADIDPSKGTLTFNPGAMTSASATATVTATAAEKAPYKSATATYTLTYYRLPQAYTECASISSDADKYIDLDFKLTSSNRVVIDFNFDVASKGGYLYGALTTNVTTETPVGSKQFTFNSASSSYAKYGTKRIEVTDGAFGTARHTLDQDGKVFTLKDANGAVEKTCTFSTETEAFKTDYSMYLFRCNSGSSLNNAKATIYSCQIYKSGNLDMNLIPCTRNSDSKDGMLDLVSGLFYELLLIPEN